MSLKAKSRTSPPRIFSLLSGRAKLNEWHGSGRPAPCRDTPILKISLHIIGALGGHWGGQVRPLQNAQWRSFTGAPIVQQLVAQLCCGDLGCCGFSPHLVVRFAPSMWRLYGRHRRASQPLLTAPNQVFRGRQLCSSLLHNYAARTWGGRLSLLRRPCRPTCLGV
jgi:hypothetical protein